jgi:hypothetical protein
MRALDRLGMLNDPAWATPIGQHISGNSLAVNLEKCMSHFPEEIYDEDWLFMYDALAGNTVIKARATSRQQPYDPFATPQRAASEEFGNTMSKGLYDNLRSSDRSPLLHKRYWRQVIDSRRLRQEMLLEAAEAFLARSVDVNPADADRVRHIIGALQAVLEARKTISPELCIAYYRAWYEVDKPQWVQRMSGLPAAEGITSVLERLDLHDFTTASEILASLHR